MNEYGPATMVLLPLCVHPQRNAYTDSVSVNAVASYICAPASDNELSSSFAVLQRPSTFEVYP